MVDYPRFCNDEADERVLAKLYEMCTFNCDSQAGQAYK